MVDNVVWITFPRYTEPNMPAGLDPVKNTKYAAYLDYERLWVQFMTLLRDLRTRPNAPTPAERYIYAFPRSNEATKEALELAAKDTADAVKAARNLTESRRAEYAAYVASQELDAFAKRQEQLKLWEMFRKVIDELAINKYVVEKCEQTKMTASAYKDALMSMTLPE